MLRTNVHTFNAVYTVHCTMYMYTKVRARNFRQSIIMKPSIENSILCMESGNFVEIFAKYSFMWFIYILFLFTNFLNKIYTIYWLMLKINVQGVPRNMTIARRLESRLWYMNLFVTFILLTTVTCMILETIIT